MVAKGRAGARVKDCEAEFEVINFQASTAMCRAVSEGKQDAREIMSGPLLVAEQFRFAISVTWTVTSDGLVDDGKNIGVHVKRLDQSPGDCAISLELGVMNLQPSLSRKLNDARYYTISTGKSRGWSRSFAPRQGFVDLPMARVLDPCCGWLFNGALRVSARISVVVGDEEPQCPSPVAFGEREVCDSLQGLLSSRRFADVTIKVGDEHIEAHSLIISARSHVFARMLSCPMKEATEKVIHLEDLEAASVKALLAYLYTGRVCKSFVATDDAALGLLHTAHRFDVAGLIQHCVQALVSRLEVQTVAERLEVADLASCSDFKAHCLDFIRKHFVDVQDTEAYNRLVDRRPALLRDIMEVIMPPAKRLRERSRYRVSEKTH
eukprot:TRINITY_DN14413_c0_g1_i1.p1 TRINITY_DN14413_c0_g1~~TRINITY_DN14413_c0_g1_i1.p1  ORF type:complete len:379 (+),score=68.80 TRINITY_DN14413_c0_g1_i1:133-1269(+)